jgi:hypothetical protein
LPEHEKEKADKSSSMTTFAKLYHYGDRKASNRRPSTADSSLKSKSSLRDSKNSREFKVSTDDKNRNVLRSRTESLDETSRPENITGKPKLKNGLSVMEQLGTIDHEGWMFKKTETYNSWKQRYFLLKGAHLYWLRGNNKMVCLDNNHVLISTDA